MTHSITAEQYARILAKHYELDLDWDNPCDLDLLDRTELMETAEKILARLAWEGFVVQPQQHQEDARLRRWRWPKNPDFVVYPQEERGAWVIRESEPGAIRWYDAELAASCTASESEWRGYAGAYLGWLNANPEPKPWHDAKPGEVWLLTFRGFETTGASPWTVRLGRRFTDPLEFAYPQNGNTLALTNPEIVTGRRIWPEATA